MVPRNDIACDNGKVKEYVRRRKPGGCGGVPLMHVLIIPSEHFVTSLYPLGGIFQYQQANSLHRAGVKVGVVSPGLVPIRFLFRRNAYAQLDVTGGYPVLRRYERRLTPARWLNVSPIAVGFYQRLGLSLYEEYVARYGTPDVVHAHNIEFAGFIAQAVHAKTGIPYVITEHSSLVMQNDMEPERRRAAAACLQQAGAVTAVSSALADVMRARIAPAAIDVLPNIVDAFLLDSPLVARTGGSEGTVFLCIASLDINKNHALLIEAFAARFKGTSTTLRLGGTGTLEQSLRRLVARLGIAPQVAFLGHLDRPAVLSEMQGADAIVLSSTRETFGVVLIEALACGRPVISTRCGGPDDIVTESCGILVEPGDFVAMGEAMVQIAGSGLRFVPECLREECRRRYGEAVFVERARRVYRMANGAGA